MKRRKAQAKSVPLNPTKTIRRGLRKLNLRAYYAAINQRYFGGKLDKDAVILWKTEKQILADRKMRKDESELMGYCGMTKGWKPRIVLNLDWMSEHPTDLLNTFIHECIHAKMPFGDTLNRKSSYAEGTNTAHGEDFGTESRRINQQVGYKLMSDRECSYGMAGLKWANENVMHFCGEYWYVDERGIETAKDCDFEGTRKEMAKHKKEHAKQYDEWYEEFGEANEKYGEFKLFGAGKDILNDDECWAAYQKLGE